MNDPRPLDLSSLQTIFPSTAAPTSRDVRADRLVTKVNRRRFATVANCKKAAKQIGKLPGPGEALHLLLAANAFACFDILPALIELVGRPATAVRLATLGINDRHVEHMDRMASCGLLRDVGMVASEYFRAADPEQFQHAGRVFAKHGFRLAAARSHAKIIAVQFGKLAYVCESSGNLRSCRAAEQMTIFCSPDLYRWHASWIDKLTDGGD